MMCSSIIPVLAAVARAFRRMEPKNTFAIRKSTPGSFCSQLDLIFVLSCSILVVAT